jgi:L-lysine 6-transaminase
MLDPQLVHGVLARHQLADGFPFVLDLEGSHGVWLRDAITGREYLDCFTSFASWPIGYRHPAMNDAAFLKDITLAAVNNPANSDVYTQLQAQFVRDFATHTTPAGFPHHFWIAGGALAIENAMKVAFDWKARLLGRTKMTDDVNDLVILHFKQAFHGRSGYTMSCTNTVPDKTGLFPKFDWPRVHNPAIRYDLEGRIANDVEAEEARSCAEIEAAFARHGNRIAAIIVEPVQGEGGDNHFRTEFIAKLRQYATEREAMLIFDEVQTGFYSTGKPWMWQNIGVAPDIVAFGKKTQVCGIYANTRVDEVADNVFQRPSRINSTWGGSLVDMVRAKRFIEIIERERLAENIAERGCQVLGGLRAVAKEHGHISNVRGIGSWQAFTCQSPEARKAMLAALRENGLIALASGTESVRLRMPLVLSKAEADVLVERVAAAIPAVAKAC